MTIQSVFIDRPPNARELELLRLLLSTYQDGSGMLKPGAKWKTTLPGWRDFERACAAAFNGMAIESKFFVDVIFSLTSKPPTFYGIDCKMKQELEMVNRKNKIYVELTNASAELWNHLATRGITEQNLRDQPEQAGRSLIEAVERIKKVGSGNYPLGTISTLQSYYLVLLWNPNLEYQLFQLPLELPNSTDLRWSSRMSKRQNSGMETLIAQDADGVLYEWYGRSGGQLKYYPPTASAIWSSERFKLEPLREDTEYELLAKVKSYFPELWNKLALL